MRKHHLLTAIILAAATVLPVLSTLPVGATVKNIDLTLATITDGTLTLTDGDFTITVTQNGGTTPSANTSNPSITVYGKNQLTITSPYVITAVNLKSNKTGDLTYAGKSITVSANEDVSIDITDNEVFFTIGAYVRLFSLSVDYHLHAPEAAVSDVETNSITATWNAVHGAETYQIRLYEEEYTYAPIFTETFNTNSGKGGNDGSFVEGGESNPTFDNEGWTATNVASNDQCVKVGIESNNGLLVSPDITFHQTEGVVSFRAGAWSQGCNGGACKDRNEILLSASNGTLAQTEFTLNYGQFDTYEVALTDINTDQPVQLTFKPKYEPDTKDAHYNRFYLDDVVVKEITDKVAVESSRSPISGIEGTSYVVENLDAASQYYVEVMACAADIDCSDYSVRVGAKTAEDSQGSGQETGAVEAADSPSILLEGTIVHNPARLPLTLYNLSGQVLTRTTADLDLSTLAPGLYLIQSGHRHWKVLR